VFVSSEIIVTRTILFADSLHLSHYFISLVMLSLGTNLPEMTLAIRAILNRKKSVAFGDYLGSAAANTLLFGVFTFLSGNGILVQDNFWITFIFIIFGLGLFYVFALSKHNLSPKEAKILLGVYVAFILAELFVG
jgi:cation:H+ antiporter